MPHNSIYTWWGQLIWLMSGLLRTGYTEPKKMGMVQVELYRFFLHREETKVRQFIKGKTLEGFISLSEIDHPLKVTYSQKVFHSPNKVPNHCPEHILFWCIVLRTVIWHIFLEMEKLSEIKPPLIKVARSGKTSNCQITSLL